MYIGLGILGLCAIASSPSYAGEGSPGPTPQFANADYDYAPSVMISGTTVKYWWCAYGSNPNPIGHGDVIDYRTYNTSTGAWGAIQTVFHPAATVPPATGTRPWDSAHVCDPDVVMGTFSYLGTSYAYAMYYTSTDTLPTSDPQVALPERNYCSGCYNRIGVAFSHDGISWTRYGGNPIISSVSPGNNYGAGQSSSLNTDGVSKIDIFYRDEPGREYYRHSNDGYTFGAATLLTASGFAAGGDMAYDTTTSNFVSVQPVDGLRVGEINGATLRTGGGTWITDGWIDKQFTGWPCIHNPGLTKDVYGNLYLATGTFSVVFGAGATGSTGVCPDGTTSGTWDLAASAFARSPNTNPLWRYFNSSNADHWVSTGWVSAGYNTDLVLGYVFTTGITQPGTVALYSCITSYGPDHFISSDPACEGQIRIGILGMVYAPPPAAQPAGTIPIYRCFASWGEHFVSNSPTCEGQTTEWQLGWVKATA